KGLSPVRHQPKKYSDPLEMCLVKGDWKIVWKFGPQKVERFHRVIDPGENRSISEKGAQNRAPSVDELKRWYEDLPKYEAGQEIEIDEEDLQRLKSLGYIGD
ncbi:MAG: hypothetical protein JXN60_06030, partial [Lentisphaerae bacterium]|nr:hypothetical protein [Lentisphaerota bacterium]